MKASILLTGLPVLFMFFSCAENNETPNLAELTTNPVNDITPESAKSGGNIFGDGGSSVTARGVCWSINPSPTTGDNKTNDGSGGGSFVSLMTGLAPDTEYYIRAYATTSNGTAYGLTYSFTTTDDAISITTKDVFLITDQSASSGGDIASDGGSKITVSGICWGTSPLPTVSDNKTIDGSNGGSFGSGMTNLNANTLYYIRAYATNSNSTYYGDQKMFTTIPPSEERKKLAKLSVTWNIQNVKNNTEFRTNEYPGMTITISGIFVQDGTYNYSSDADMWPSVSPWKAIDTWKFKPESVTNTFRQSDLQEMTWVLSNSDKTLTVSFNYQGPGFNNARKKAVTGDWTFVFTTP